MPYDSDKQRGYMHWAHPAIARRWDAEEHKQFASFLPAREFPELRDGGLVGISDRVLADHLRLYERAVAELAGIQAAYPRMSWMPPADVPSNEVQALLMTPVAAAMVPGPDGSVMQPDGRLAACLGSLKDELLAKGISWFPAFYFGDADFWTADRATSINLPWYLATDLLWRLVNDQTARYSEEDLMRVLRHETGHALGYAFELWKRPEWAAAFGDFEKPYRDEFEIDTTSTDFVQNLHQSTSAANAHYAQKHPDEDWAETFATWLDPGSRWREIYAAMPGAAAKLEAVELMIVGRGAAYGEPAVTLLGRRIPASTLTYTIGEFLGQNDMLGAPSQHAALLRREPAVYASVVLHELYFGALRRGEGLIGARPTFLALAVAAFGSFDSWAQDMRAIGAATEGWGVTAWCERDGRLRNFLVEGHDRGLPADCRILVAMDCHEHAFAGDVGAARKDIYLGAFFRNLDWTVVEARLATASRLPVPVVAPMPAGPPVPPPADLAIESAPPDLVPETWTIPGQEGP